MQLHKREGQGKGQRGEERGESVVTMALGSGCWCCCCFNGSRMHLIETVCLEKCAQFGFTEVEVDVKAIKFLRLPDREGEIERERETERERQRGREINT